MHLAFVLFRKHVFHESEKEKGVTLSITAQQKTTIVNYLETYSHNRKLLRMDRYEQEFFSDYICNDTEMPSEAPLARALMFEVRHFILSLPNCDEKLFLYYHYVKGNTVPRCAELLGISDRSAFRMKNRALELAYENKYGQA